LSVEPLADEVIVVDSTDEDNTTNIIKELAEENNKIKHIIFQYEAPNSIAVACQIGLLNANYKWILKWEGDCILKFKAVKEWKNRIEKLNKNKYYVISLRRINLEGDIYHQPKNYPLGTPEARLFTFSPDLRFLMKITENTQAEQIMGNSVWGHRFPPWYSVITWNEPYIYHCNIKSTRRMLVRMFWRDYMKLNNTDLTLEQYAEQKIAAEWHMTMQQAEQRVMEDLKQNLMPYDETRFGKLPRFWPSLPSKDDNYY
jgi:glycosyltransferase involved in cell wall biosynthesis